MNLSRDQTFLVRFWESTTRAAGWRSPRGCARFRSVGVACRMSKFWLLVYLDFFVVESLRPALLGSLAPIPRDGRESGFPRRPS